MSLKNFQQSQNGVALAGILTRPDMIKAMEAASAQARPAAEAVGPAVAEAVGTLGDTEKKLVGRWIREVMAARGWRPDRKVDVRPGHFFRRGTVYRRPDPSDDAAPPPWLQEARDAVAALGNPGTVSDMIATRRRDARQEAR